MGKYFILTLSVAIIIFAACNKKATPSADSHTDWLRNGRWHIASGTLTVKLPNGTDTVLNYMDWIPVCHRNDYMVFSTATTAAFFNSNPTCAPGDPDSISFNWTLTNNDKYLSLNCSDHLYYSVTESILPFVFDTLQLNPYVVLDTIYGVNDTAAGYTRTVVVLDTVWNLHFDSTYVSNTLISNAPITNFTENSFTIYFTLLAHYPDSTNHHTNMFIYPDPGTGAPDTLDANPIIRQDTFKYSVTYTH